MSLKANLQLMAEYNRWMNDNIFLACATLNQRTLTKDKGAFFGSIMGTLNHIMVADLIWLNRFAGHPSGFSALDALKRYPVPTTLDTELHNDLAELSDARNDLDNAIVHFTQAATERDYLRQLAYRTTSGEAQVRHFGSLVQHFFNHQTHHRGQVTTLLIQEGVEPGVTDLLAIIPEVEV